MAGSLASPQQFQGGLMLGRQPEVSRNSYRNSVILYYIILYYNYEDEY